MATTVTDFLTAIGIRLNKTISTTSDPTDSQVYQVLYEVIGWLSQLCVQKDSEIGRKTASISLSDGTAAYTDCVDDIIAPANDGWLVKDNSRDKITLTTEFDSINYSPASTAECEPDKYYLDSNGKITFLQTPEDSYTANIPYWYHQTKIAASSYTITGATKASPCVVSCSGGHNFNTGDRTYIASVAGMTELNSLWFTVTKVSSTTFSLDGIDSSSYTAYTSGGTASTALPFNGAFDLIIIEAVSMRFQDIDEYKQQFEQSWLSFLLKQATIIIEARKNPESKVRR